MIAQWQNPTGQTTKALEDLGLSAEDVNPSMNSLADIMGTLEEAGMDSSQAMQLVGTEAGPALLAMMNEGEEGLANFTNQLRDSEGAAEDMAATMMDNTAGSFKEFMSVLEGLAISISEIILPYINSFIE